MVLKLWFGLLVALFGFQLSCGSSDSDGNSGGDDDFDGETACLELTNTATEIESTKDPAAPPEMTGGTLVDGTYFLTERVNFNQDGEGYTEQERLDIMNNGQYLSYVAATSLGELRGGLTATTSGINLTATGLCGDYAGYNLSVTYTATATTFTSLETNGKMSVYTKP